MDIESSVKDYYGKIIKKTTDLKTDACCTKESYPLKIRKCMKEIHEDIVNSYFGGLVIPDCLEDCKVLDLGWEQVEMFIYYLNLLEKMEVLQ